MVKRLGACVAIATAMWFLVAGQRQASAQDAAAAPPATAECKFLFAGTGVAPEKWAEFMTAQIAVGRSEFVSPVDGILCAW